MNIQTLFLFQEDFSGLPIAHASGLAAAGIIEDSMVGNTDWNDVVVLPFGGSMWLTTAWIGPCEEPPYDMPECSLKIRRSYAMQMYNLPERVVKDLMTYDWSIIDGFYGFDTYDSDIDGKLCAIDRNLTDYCSTGVDNYIGTNAYKEGRITYIFHYPDENGHLQMPAPISITSQMDTDGYSTQFNLLFSY